MKKVNLNEILKMRKCGGKRREKKQNVPLVLLRPISRVRQKRNFHIKQFTQLRIRLILALRNSRPNRI